MDLYTLTDQFLAKDAIDQYVSVIWTERYSEAGEVQIVVPATAEMIDKLRPGTFLALRGTDEVMLLETQSIENNLMTVAGKTLLIFLDERLVWFKNAAAQSADDPKILDWAAKDKAPGSFIAYVVYEMVIDPKPYPTQGYPNTNLDWAFDKIDKLSLGAVDTSGTPKRLTAPTGPLYEAITTLAKQEGVGISLYLESATIDTGYSLKFKTYRGVDHSTGSAAPLVRLVPDFDTLSDLKEVRSISGYKNVCYVWWQNAISWHYAEPTLPKPEGFERRCMVRDAEGNPVGNTKGTSVWGWPITYVGPDDIAAFREQNARDALANHNYILAIDGQTSPNADYKYGIDYGLGDIIELEGITGAISKARITEYIRSHDKSGLKEYPTITVLEPENAGEGGDVE